MSYISLHRIEFPMQRKVAHIYTIMSYISLPRSEFPVQRKGTRVRSRLRVFVPTLPRKPHLQRPDVQPRGCVSSPQQAIHREYFVFLGSLEAKILMRDHKT